MEKSRFFSGFTVIITLVIFMILTFLVNSTWIGAGSVVAASGGKPVPDMVFGYTAQDLSSLFQALNDEGRAAYLNMNIVDFFFALSYGLFYFVCLGWLSRNLFPGVKPMHLIGLIGVLAAFCDEIENIIFRAIVTGFSEGSGLLALVVSVFSRMKFILIVITMALIVVGLIAFGMKALFINITKKRNIN